MTKKSVELFLLPVENDEQKREIYDIIDNEALDEIVDRSVRGLSLYLEEAKEKFYTVRNTIDPNSYHPKLSELIESAVNKWIHQFSMTKLGRVELTPGNDFRVEVVGTLTFTFKYSPDIQRVFDRDRSLYCIPPRIFTKTDDLVTAIGQANRILLKKSNCPISSR